MVLLKNATFIDWETLEFKLTDILVEEGSEGKLSFSQNPEINASEIIDCTGKFVTKSFVVGHHHVYSALSRGMGAPKKSPGNFREILKYIWWTLDKSLDKEMIEASALATAVACIKAGSTFVVDHHSSPNFIEGSLDIIAGAFNKVGVSHLLSYEISDRDGTKKAEEGISETENYIRNNQGLIGLHASFTVGKDSMEKAANLMHKYNSGFHIHVAEDKYDQEYSLLNYNKRVVERLNDYGVLNSSKTILGHCLHLSENERKILKNSNAWVVQNTESNLNNNVGRFNAAGLSKNILIGTDGMHSDMLRSAQQAFFTGQGHDIIDYESAYQRLRNIHQYLKKNHFKGDSENNLVVMDYQSPTPIDKSNFLGHFIFGFSSNDVQHVISDGKLVLKDKVLQTADEKEIMDFSKGQALKLWEKMSN